MDRRASGVVPGYDQGELQHGEGFLGGCQFVLYYGGEVGSCVYGGRVRKSPSNILLGRLEVVRQDLLLVED